MKKIIIILILFLLSVLTLGAQEYYTRELPKRIKEPNTIYLIFQPVDFGVGLRYDRIITYDDKLFGVYGALTHGEFELETGEKIKNHFKFVSGVLLYLDPYNENFNVYLGTGLSFNIYDGLYNIPPTFDPRALNQWSFELSCNARINNNWNLGIRLDPIKWESSIDVGFSF